MNNKIYVIIIFFLHENCFKIMEKKKITNSLQEVYPELFYVLFYFYFFSLVTIDLTNMEGKQGSPTIAIIIFLNANKLDAHL